jgi:AraC family transcriptional regulator, regulatory protein of adaptative response / DNA-3-methyladenine glycosylase II
MKKTYSEKEYYQAHLARDPRFDGKFFVAVKTTMIYCRPTCPARKAHLKNLTFYIHAAQAEEAGYRPCLRCRPESAPGSAAWIGTSATVQRAIRMMDSYALDDLSIGSMAEKLGVGERWLRELFQKQVGASPKSILISKQLDIAKNLLEHSSASVTDIAFSSGFQSLRRFNDAFKTRFKQAPSAFRKNPSSESLLHLQLSYRPPYAWDCMIDFLKKRAIEGVELVEKNTYQRTIAHGDIYGWMKATHGEKNKINIEFSFNKSANILDFVARLKNMFDLDADPMAIETILKKDKKLKPFLEPFKGLRIPGSWDGFELAVRAIVGQRISVKAARTILGKIVKTCGTEHNLPPSAKLERFFPTPQAILTADLSKVGLPVTRAESLKALASEVIAERIVLDGTADSEETCKQLLAIKGIGPWTVEYIAMRALRNPDVIPVTDLVIKKKIEQLQLNPDSWVPWRAYGAILLWNIVLEDKV